MKTVVDIQFNAFNVPGGADAILGPAQCADAVVKIVEYKVLDKINVNLVLDEYDQRVPKLLALLARHGEDGSVIRRDIYTEDDLQAARLLWVQTRIDASACAGPRYGTTYDMAHACATCGTGARQTSSLIVDYEDLRTVDKHRVAATNYEDLLIRDTDVERLVAANVTGAVFWPVSVKQKNGETNELRWQQALIEHVMPPMVTSCLTQENLCPTCYRGGYGTATMQSRRLTYRAEDLVNVKDFNLTWEWLGGFKKTPEEVKQGFVGSHPWVLVTPKVMNLLRGKTKKEQKYQGCDFIPIWIENEKAS